MPGLESLQEAMEQDLPNADAIRAAFVEAQPIIEAREELDNFSDDLEDLLKQSAIDFDKIDSLRKNLFLREAPSLAALTKSLDEVRKQINKFVADDAIESNPRVAFRRTRCRSQKSLVKRHWRS